MNTNKIFLLSGVFAAAFLLPSFISIVDAQQATLAFTINDKVNWRADHSSVSSVTETYSYDATRDVVTVSLQFNQSDFAPLPPMLALALDYGFPIVFDKTISDGGWESSSIFGPLKGAAGTNSYSYSVAGLSKYVFQSYAPGSDPAPSYLTTRLEAEINRICDGGTHLSPWLTLKNVPGGDANRRGGQVYWNHPGEVLYLLSEAGPLLSTTTLNKLKTYLRSERNSYKPEDIWSMSFTAGTRRQYFSPDDEILEEWETDLLVWRTQGINGKPKIWNLYGLYRFYELMGEKPAAAVMSKCTDIVNNYMSNRDWATLYWTKNKSPHYNAVHAVNQTFAGLIGYIRLARLSNDANAEALGWGLLAKMTILRYAMGKYARYQYDTNRQSNPVPDLSDPAWWPKLHKGGWRGELLTWNWTKPEDNVRQVITLDDEKIDVWEWSANGAHISDGQKYVDPDPEVKSDYPWYYTDDLGWWGYNLTPYLVPFADMAPELGLFLHDFLKPESQKYLDRIVENQPHWYMAYSEGILEGELGYMMPEDAHSQFMARSWILREGAQQLERYIDVPWLKVGDLFYIHKLTETIKAYKNGQTSAVHRPLQAIATGPGLWVQNFGRASSIHIQYSVPKEGRVRLTLLDVQGRMVRDLVRKNQKAGQYLVAWDGRTGQGAGAGSGVYWCRLQTNGKSWYKKTVLVK